MNQHNKRVAFLIISQTACLALGLWLQDRFEGSLASTLADQPAQTDPATFDGHRGAGMIRSSSGLSYERTAIRTMAFVWIGGLQSVVAYLVLTRLQTDSSRQVLESAQESARRQKELVRTRDAVIFGLAKLAESRDPETGYHLERIAYYSTRLAESLQRHPSYRHQITSSFVRLIGISSALHDIGKVGVRDSVLLKPGKLEAEERRIMEEHSAIGAECIREIERRLGNSNFLQMAREIAWAHHERWDGTGYPRGLVGEAIPLAARIVAIADVYDALSSRRVYKGPFPHNKCVSLIREGAGTQFDPDLVATFLEIEPQFQEIARRCGEAPVPATDSDDRSSSEIDTDRTTSKARPMPLAALRIVEDANAHEMAVLST